MKSYNEDFYRLFNEIADLMSLIDENSFKIRAYRTAARNLKERLEPITAKATPQKLMEIPGIGTALAEKMEQYLKTGKIPYLETLRRQIPKPVRELLKIPHLGPRRVRELYINLGVKSKKDLIAKAKSGAISELKGFGPRLVKDILDALETGQEKKRRHPRKEVEPIGKKLKALLQKIPGVKKVEIGGSYRRGAPTVGDLDLLVMGKDVGLQAEKAIQKTFPNLTVLGAGPTKLSFILFPQNLQIDIRFVPPESGGAALLYFTGSKEYNVMMRKVAIEKGCLLNEYGLFKDGELIAGATEEDVCQKLGLPWLPPQKRI